MDRLNTAEIEALRLALDDEYLAWTTYDQVLNDFGDVRPFANIVGAEARHIGALKRIFERYGVPIPPNPWPGRVPRYDTVHDACVAAVRAEIENGALYDRLIASTAKADILEVFRNLRDASQERHLPAFQRCTDRGGAARCRG